MKARDGRHEVLRVAVLSKAGSVTVPMRFGERVTREHSARGTTFREKEVA